MQWDLIIFSNCGFHERLYRIRICKNSLTFNGRDLLSNFIFCWAQRKRFFTVCLDVTVRRRKVRKRIFLNRAEIFLYYIINYFKYIFRTTQKGVGIIIISQQVAAVFEGNQGLLLGIMKGSPWWQLNIFFCFNFIYILSLFDLIT